MIKNDKEFADSLCRKDIDAKKSFQQIYTDELYFIASKIVNAGFDEDSWTYRTKTGYDIQVNDDVSDTYVWLIHQVEIKSCLYKGLSEFKNYILTVLNSSFMKKDWLKRKTGVTGYIPKHIKVKGDNYISVYRLMRQKKDDQTIMSSLDMQYEDFMDYKYDIERSLAKHGQLDLIEDYKISSLSLTNEEGDAIYDPADSSLSVEHKNDLSVSLRKLDRIVQKFNKAEQRIATAYWGKGLSAEDVFRFLEKDAPNILTKSNIASASDVYKFVTRFIDRFYDNINTETNPITKKGVRTIIENYYLIKK